MKVFLKPMIVAALILFTTSANALLIEISDDNFATVIASASDSDNDGLVSYSGALGDWTVIVAGSSSPIIGDEYLDILDLLSLSISGAEGTLYIRLTDTGFTRGNARYSTAFGGTTTGTVGAQSYIDYTNALFGQGFLLSDSGPISGPAFSAQDSGHVTPAGPFSMSIYATVTHSGRGISSFDYMVTVPEPGTLALLGIGLLALGLSARGRSFRVTNG